MSHIYIHTYIYGTVCIFIASVHSFLSPADAIRSEVYTHFHFDHCGGDVHPMPHDSGPGWKWMAGPKKTSGSNGGTETCLVNPGCHVKI